MTSKPFYGGADPSRATDPRCFWIRRAADRRHELVRVSDDHDGDLNESDIIEWGLCLGTYAECRAAKKQLAADGRGAVPRKHRPSCPCPWCARDGRLGNAPPSYGRINFGLRV